MSMDQIIPYKNRLTREERLEDEVHWLEEYISKLTIENMSLRQKIDELEKALKETK